MQMSKKTEICQTKRAGKHCFAVGLSGGVTRAALNDAYLVAIALGERTERRQGHRAR
jgi:hypothetical protein